jgi:uncharacterized membrane protein
MTRIVTRWFLVAIYAAAGVAHVRTPDFFMPIMPGWVPVPQAVILWTGIAEFAGAAALAQPVSMPLRRLAGWSLAAYALCVWPANINHMLIDGGANHVYHIPRMALQPVLIWAALWTSGAIDWPWRHQHREG